MKTEAAGDALKLRVMVGSIPTVFTVIIPMSLPERHEELVLLQLLN